MSTATQSSASSHSSAGPGPSTKASNKAGDNKGTEEKKEEEEGEIDPQQVKKEKREKPVIHTTVVDVPPEYFGAKGQCDFVDCNCPAFYGSSGVCVSCKHANLFHSVKLWKAQAASLEKQRQEHRAELILSQKYRYRQELNMLHAQRTGAIDTSSGSSNGSMQNTSSGDEHEADEDENGNIAEEDSSSSGGGGSSTSEDNSSMKTEVVNTYPCGVVDCDCKKMEQPLSDPVLNDAGYKLPKICRKCKHGEMYHVKMKKEKRIAGVKGVKGKSTQNTGRSSGASSQRVAQKSARGTKSVSAASSSRARKKS